MGNVPQCSVDEETMDLMKFKIFPWSAVKFYPRINLIKHGREGWQIPYGEVY
jgi:hypothetical protein